MVRPRTVRLRGMTAVWLVASIPALGADWTGSVRGQVSGGVDSNPGRDFVSDGGASTPDGFLQGIVNLSGGVATGPFVVDATYDFGGRKFITQPRQDTLIQSATLVATALLP